jgi:DNA-binding NtrC family response regulator
MLENPRAFDLLLTDYAMPKMSGETLIKSVQQHQPGLKVLLMTGHVDVLRAGGIADVPLLTKPFRVAELNEHVARALSRAGTAQASPAATG